MIIIGRRAGLPAALATIALLAAGVAGAADKSQSGDAAPKATPAANKAAIDTRSDRKPMSLTPGKPKTSQTPETAKKASAGNTPIAAAKPMMTKPAASGAAKQRTARWSYRGDTGPAHWGNLAKSYHACGAGRQQSPVDLESVEPVRLKDLTFRYKVSLIRMIHTGDTVRVAYGKGSHILLGDERYVLDHFQFRTPSEHTVAGRSFPMEIQFVHKNAEGRVAIVALLVASGPASLAARELWDRLPTKAHTRSKKTRALINARDLLPDDTAHFRYRGSLTTPPCTESVTWLILQTPVSFSENQIARLRGIVGENARPVQARNGRYLLQSTGG